MEVLHLVHSDAQEAEPLRVGQIVLVEGNEGGGGETLTPEPLGEEGGSSGLLAHVEAETVLRGTGRVPRAEERGHQEPRAAVLRPGLGEMQPLPAECIGAGRGAPPVAVEPHAIGPEAVHRDQQNPRLAPGGMAAIEDQAPLRRLRIGTRHEEGAQTARGRRTCSAEQPVGHADDASRHRGVFPDHPARLLGAASTNVVPARPRNVEEIRNRRPGPRLPRPRNPAPSVPAPRRGTREHRGSGRRSGRARSRGGGSRAARARASRRPGGDGSGVCHHGGEAGGRRARQGQAVGDPIEGPEQASCP